MQLVKEAQGQKPRAQRTVERFTARLVPSVLAGALLLIVVPPLFSVAFRVSFLRAMTLLVAASPCALALAAPSAMLAGIGQAARHGVLVTGGAHLETLGRLEAVAFDKTGTLTHGRPEVTDVVPLSEGLDADRLPSPSRVPSGGFDASSIVQPTAVRRGRTLAGAARCGTMKIVGTGIQSKSVPVKGCHSLLSDPKPTTRPVLKSITYRERVA